MKFNEKTTSSRQHVAAPLTEINRRLGPLILFFLLLCAGLGSLHAAYNDPAIALKVLSSGTNANQPIITLKTSGNTTATLVATATNFTPTTYTWSQVSGMNNSFATTGTVSFSSLQTTAPQVTVTLPATGVYQFQVVASDGVNSVSRYTWVNVWDNVSALNADHSVGKNPDIAPPTSVRQLSLDPGPYCHPRLFFNRSDWAELSAKTVSSNDVKTAFTSLQSRLVNHFDKTGDPLKTYADVLAAYAQGGYDSSYYTNTVLPAYTAAGSAISSTLLGRSPDSSFYDALLTACYLAWIGTDPTVAHGAAASNVKARFNYLATLVGASAKVELTRNGDTNPVYNLAFSYDLLYDWMTPAQQADTRDYLYAIGYGIYNSGGGGTQKTPLTSMPSGRNQNGDFPNLADSFILSALAIEGEESSVTSAVQSTYGPTVSPASGANAWPYASPASVSNLYRQVRWNSEWLVSPWGSMLNATDYFELSMAYSAPAVLALARRGQNQFVTTHFYQSSLGAFYNLSPRESDGKMMLFDHHDGLGFGNGPGMYNGRYILKYMYPDDPMVDYVYRAFRAETGNELAQVIFGSEPTTQNLTSVAQNKSLALTKLDPLRGVAVTRNSWDENDLNVYFESRADVEGHMHAEANNFSLYALGRAWSSPPGYHCTINDLAATVLIQNPALSTDAATSGYIGQSPSSATQTTTSANFPTPPCKLLEVNEDPAHQWTLFSGDAAPAYNFAYNSALNTQVDTGRKMSSFFYDGVLRHLLPEYQTSFATTNIVVNQSGYNPVQYAYRSLLTIRGSRPYVLVLDDITVDGTTPHNYRWSMPCAVSFGGSGGRFIKAGGGEVYSSLAMQSGATSTDAVLYHSPIDDGTAAGKPRLLVRDVSEQSNTGQPAIFLDNRPSGFAGGNLTYGYDNNSQTYGYVPSNRVMIQRNNVASPSYKVLLFPYRTGETTPATSWNAANSILSVNLQNGFADAITLDKTKADHRTRVVAFSRTQAGRTAPTLMLPTNLVISSNAIAASGQPGGTGVFTVGAMDDLNNILAPSVSLPSGSVFPIGVNVVKVTATDSLGQISSRQFTVTVLPAAPQVTVTSVSNLTSGSASISLNWASYDGATAYSVKRSTTPGGPYTVISDRQTDTSYTDSNLTGTAYYYVVTAWVDSYEGPASTEIALAPATSVFTGQILGTAAPGNGVYQQGNSYLLTTTGGQIGAFSEQCTLLSIPWVGDGSFTARLSSLSGLGGSISQFCNFGVMLRANTAPNGLMAYSGYNTYVAPVSFIYRSTAGGLATSSGPFSSYVYIPPPMWLRLVRSGNTFTAFYSYDGVNWLLTASPATINLPASALVGLAAEGQNTTTTTAFFDNLVFLGTPTISSTDSSVTLQWAGAQAASYSVQRSTNPGGPFQTVASNLTATTYPDTTVTLGNTYYYTITATGALGGATVSPIVKAAATKLILNVPANLTITPNTANPVVNYSATATDTIDGPVNVVLTPPSGSNFASGTTTTVNCSASNSSGNTVTGTFTVTLLPYTPPAPGSPWTVQNIGTQPTTPGFATYDAIANLFNITGNGGTSGGGANGDIWSGTSEGFTYIWQPWSGDGIFTARVASFSSPDSGAKAGIMFRETLSTGAKNSITYISKSGDVFTQHKIATNGTGSNFISTKASTKSIPYWLRLVRSGNNFSSYMSPDGVVWIQAGSTTANTMSGTALNVGLAVAPRTGGSTANVVFDNVTFLGLPGAPTGLSAVGGTGQIALTWNAVAGAASYSVKSSNTAGGPYTIIASGLTSPTFTNTGLSTSAKRYYVITATNAVGEGAAGTEASATTYSTLQAWRYLYFGTSANSGLAADTADPDRDGMTNLLEYALGTDPTSAASVVRPTLGRSGNFLILSFIRLKSDVTYLVEGSSDLTTWSTLATNAGSVGQSVTVTDTVAIPTSNPPRRFLRLRITAP